LTFLGKALIFTILVTLVSHAHASKAKSSQSTFSNRSLDSILRNKKTRVRKYDRITASNIISAYKLIDKGYAHSKVIKSAKKSIKNNKNFSIFSDWIKEIHFAHKEQVHYKLRGFCSAVKKRDEANALRKKLRSQSALFCYNNYIKSLTKYFVKKNRVSRKDITAIRDSVEYLVHPYVNDNFFYLLTKISDNNPDLHMIISQFVSDYFVDQQTAPDVEILKHIKITADLTRLIQIKGIEKDSIYSLFSGRLNRLVKDAFNAADEGKSESEVHAKSKHLLNFYFLNQEHLPTNKTLKKMLSLAKSFSRRSLFKPAQDVLKIIASSPSKYQEKAYFELLWIDIVNDNYAAAYRNILRMNLTEKVDYFSDSKLKYWIAYTLMKNGISDYQKIMQDILEKNPLDFYAVMSAKNLQDTLNISPDKLYKNILQENKIPFRVTTKTFTKNIYRSIIRLKTWGAMEFSPFIRSEHRSLTDYYSKEVIIPKSISQKNISKSLLTYLSAKALYNKQNYLESFKVIYNGLNRGTLSLNGNILETLFPKPYWKRIKRHVKGFDPVIALSLIRQESGFNPKARSVVGARGLMQIMPNTAKMYRRRIKPRQLMNPVTNIKIGTKLVSDLMNKYDRNLVYVLSAYNAGEGRVSHWRKNYLTHSSILHNVENIPFRETRKYVKLIFRNLFFYKLMNSSELKDSKDKNKIFGIALGFNN
jgi:soluble lytic murein transglycosylase